MPVHINQQPDGASVPGNFEEWRGIPAAIAADASADIGIIDPAIRPLGAANRELYLFGRAVTASCEPPDFGAVVHALDVLLPGDVLVIAAGGDCSVAMIGEILSGHLRDRGCAGIVCDGAVRDVDSLGSWSDFPVFTRGIIPRGPSSAEWGDINLPVSIGGCAVNPGDLVIGDRDGLAILSPMAALTYLEAARAKLEKEEGWIASLAAGHTARNTFNLPAPEQMRAD